MKSLQGTFKSTVVGAIALVATSASVATAQTTLPLNLVVRNSDPVPGFAGESWLGSTGAYQNPGIDLANNVGFLAELADSGVISSANDAGYWYGSTGTLVNQIQEGGPALPGTTGTTFVSRQSTDMSMSPNGHMWIAGTISGGTVTTTSDQVIWTGQAGSFGAVYQEGNAVPGIAGAVQNPASSSSSMNFVNNAGQTVMFGTVVGGPAAPANSGLWVGNSGGLGLVYQTGVANAAFPGGELIKSTGVEGLNGSGVVQTVTMLDENVAPATAATAGTILNGDGTGALSIVARTGTASSIPGVTYGDAVSGFFGLTPSFTAARQGLNNGGRNVFGAFNLQGSAITAGVNDQALMTHLGGSDAIVAQTGDAAPGFGGDATLANLTSSFASAFLNNNDEVAWLGQAAGTDITTANDVGLWKTQIGGGSTLLAREGDAVPGIADAFFGAPTNVIMNNLGQVVFTSTMTGSGVAANNNWSVWAWDPSLGLVLVAREGVNYFGYLSGSPSYDVDGNGEGGANAFNDQGCIALRIPGLNGEQAIVTTCIPEPTTGLLLLALGGVGLIRRRRA